MDNNEKIRFLSGLFTVLNPSLHVTVMNRDGEVLWCSATESQILHDLFRTAGNTETCTHIFQTDHNPVILTDRFSLMYAIAQDPDQNLYLTGPVFVSEDMMEAAEKDIYDLHLKQEENQNLLHFIHHLPVIDAIRLMDVTVMLEKTVNDHAISISDIRYAGISSLNSNEKEQLPDESAYHGTYEGEQIMLRMVREGDIDHFEKQMNRMASMGNWGILAGNQSRQLKNLVLVNIVLFSRAAIEGGLSSETSLSLTDYYFQAVEGCRDLAQLTDITRIMQKDFVTRVHNCRINQKYSRPVQECIQYIERHLEEEFTLNDLAASLGYTSYYLSRRFKKETSSSMSEFICQKRLERAKFLLKTTKLPVHEISDRLQFNSQSYFTANFRKAYGIQPTEYRKKNQIL